MLSEYNGEIFQVIRGRQLSLCNRSIQGPDLNTEQEVARLVCVCHSDLDQLLL